MSALQRLSALSTWPLHGRDNIRALETVLQSQHLTPLMQQAGLATAQLAMAIAPHAQRIWVLAGPGNNGGDGFEAALHLHQWGLPVQVHWVGQGRAMPADAHAAWQRAQAAGVRIGSELAHEALQSLGPQDLIVDALLGIGAARPLSSDMKAWVQAINRSAATVLAVDVPTGLDANSGQFLGKLSGNADDVVCVKAQHTLTLVAAKPGLFMGYGRDVCGQIWLANLGWTTDSHGPVPAACLNPRSPLRATTHASHKGSNGDVAVIGGATDAHGMGMSGAALLAASAALHAGAGRVYLSLLSGQAHVAAAPDLMQRPWQELALEAQFVVCGCGGGEAIQAVLPEVLRRSAHLVLDADGLNAVAQAPLLQTLLRERGRHGAREEGNQETKHGAHVGTNKANDSVPRPQTTVITPHPLEAARLLHTSTAEVQADRLKTAQQLVAMFQCTVVLKGSGTVIAAPAQSPRIDASGNGRLATGGTGDVLAGLIGARMAQGLNAFDAACAAVAQHGQMANDWPPSHALTASRLANSLS